MSKNVIEKVKKEARRLAEKIERKVEQIVDAIPDDDQIIDKVRNGFKNTSSKVAQVSPKAAKTLRDDIERKMGNKASPVDEVVEDLNNLKDTFAKDIKNSKFVNQFTDFLKSTVALIGFIGKSSEEHGKAYNNFTKSAEALGKAISI